MLEDSSELTENAAIDTSSPVCAAMDELTDDAMLEWNNATLAEEPAAAKAQGMTEPVQISVETVKPIPVNALPSMPNEEPAHEAQNPVLAALEGIQKSPETLPQETGETSEPSNPSTEDTAIEMTDLIASEDQMPLHEAVETEVVQASVVTALQDEAARKTAAEPTATKDLAQLEVTEALSSEQILIDPPAAQATVESNQRREQIINSEISETVEPDTTPVTLKEAMHMNQPTAAVPTDSTSDIQALRSTSIAQQPVAQTVEQLAQPIASSSKKRKAEPTIGGLIASKKVRSQFKTPFKAPGKSKAAELLATSTNEAPSSSTKRPLVSATPQKVSLLKTVHSPFRSPIAKPTNVDSPMALNAELRKLEQRASILRSAVQIKKAHEAGTEESDDRLVALVDKWKEASREAARMLWDLSGASTMDSVEAVRAVSGSAYGGGGFDSSWGWAKSDSMVRKENEEERSSKDDDDELPELEDVSRSERGARRLAALREGKVFPATLSQASADEEDEKPVARWNTGKMLKQLGIDPESLGWQSEEEDFAD